jgi:hypothetical protein
MLPQPFGNAALMPVYACRHLRLTTTIHTDASQALAVCLSIRAGTDAMPPLSSLLFLVLCLLALTGSDALCLSLSLSSVSPTTRCGSPTRSTIEW